MFSNQTPPLLPNPHNVHFSGYVVFVLIFCINIGENLISRFVFTRKYSENKFPAKITTSTVYCFPTWYGRAIWYGQECFIAIL